MWFKTYKRFQNELNNIYWNYWQEKLQNILNSFEYIFNKQGQAIGFTNELWTVQSIGFFSRSWKHMSVEKVISLKEKSNKEDYLCWQASELWWIKWFSTSYNNYHYALPSRDNLISKSFLNNQISPEYNYLKIFPLTNKEKFWEYKMIKNINKKMEEITNSFSNQDILFFENKLKVEYYILDNHNKTFTLLNKYLNLERLDDWNDLLKDKYIFAVFKQPNTITNIALLLKDIRYLDMRYDLKKDDVSFQDQALAISYTAFSIITIDNNDVWFTTNTYISWLSFELSDEELKQTTNNINFLYDKELSFNFIENDKEQNKIDFLLSLSSQSTLWYLLNKNSSWWEQDTNITYFNTTKDIFSFWNKSLARNLLTDYEKNEIGYFKFYSKSEKWNHLKVLFPKNNFFQLSSETIKQGDILYISQDVEKIRWKAIDWNSEKIVILDIWFNVDKTKTIVVNIQPIWNSNRIVWNYDLSNFVYYVLHYDKNHQFVQWTQINLGKDIMEYIKANPNSILAQNKLNIIDNTSLSHFHFFYQCYWKNRIWNDFIIKSLPNSIDLSGQFYATYFMYSKWKLKDIKYINVEQFEYGWQKLNPLWMLSIYNGLKINYLNPNKLNLWKLYHYDTFISNQNKYTSKDTQLSSSWIGVSSYLYTSPYITGNFTKNSLSYLESEVLTSKKHNSYVFKEYLYNMKGKKTLTYLYVKPIKTNEKFSNPL